MRQRVTGDDHGYYARDKRGRERRRDKKATDGKVKDGKGQPGPDFPGDETVDELAGGMVQGSIR